MPHPDEITIKRSDLDALKLVAAAAISYVEGADDETWNDLLKAVEKLKASGWKWK